MTDPVLRTKRRRPSSNTIATSIMCFYAVVVGWWIGEIIQWLFK